MDKLKMAHDWAMKYGSPENFKLTVDEAWEYADAMQAEADRRSIEAKNTDASEWQPDWSRAPTWAKYWQMKISGDFHWLEEDPFSDMCDWFSSRDYMTAIAPTFGYTGAWQDSLRKRPTT